MAVEQIQPVWPLKHQGGHSLYKGTDTGPNFPSPQRLCNTKHVIEFLGASVFSLGRMGWYREGLHYRACKTSLASFLAHSRFSPELTMCVCQVRSKGLCKLLKMYAHHKMDTLVITILKMRQQKPRGLKVNCSICKAGKQQSCLSPLLRLQNQQWTHFPNTT